MPFENVTRDSRIFWLAEASAVLLADDLNALGANAITREERRQAFERLQVPPAAALSDATVIRIGQLVGASHVVVGRCSSPRAVRTTTLVVRARDIALESGRVQADIVERGTRAGALRHLRARRAPHRAGVRQVVGGDRAPASADRGLRELHQGSARRDARHRRQLPPLRVDVGAGLRPRAARAVGRLRGAGRSRARAGGGAAGAGRLGVGAARAVSRGAVRAQSQEVRRSVCDVQSARRRAADGDGPQQPRRRADSSRRGDAANRPAGLLLQQSRRIRSGRPGLFLQSRLRVLAEPRPAGRDLLAARGAAAQPGRRRRPLRAGRRARRRRQPGRSVAREGAGQAPVVHLRGVGQAAAGRRRAQRARAA